MESSSSNSEERELQQMQLEERQLNSNCMAWVKEVKIHLETLHNNSTDDTALVASSVTEGTTLEENLSTDDTTLDASAALEACLVTKGIATRSGNENRSSDNESTSSGNAADADIRPSYDSEEDNVKTGKHGLGFENKNDVKNQSLLNKANELAPSLYNIDEMGQDLLSGHKIISKEELKCEAEKPMKVKQRKSPLSYHGLYMYEKDFAKLEARCISLEPKSPNKSWTFVQNGQVLSNKSDEAKMKFDTEDLETINIKLEYSVASLLKENEHLKTIYQNLFDSIKCSRVQTKSSNVSQNKAENLKSQLSGFADKKFDKVFQKIESM
ncbi:hypothetical protein Tco_0097508 [Tanacetum coccineum]